MAARTGVAVGEAVLIPGAVSLLADLFSPDKRGRAMGIFGAGAPVGAGVGLLAGGLLLGHFTPSSVVLPFLGELLPWQATFVAIGLPGIVIALLMLFVPEPRRIGAARNVPTAGVPPSLTVGFLRSNARTFTAIMLGAGFLYLAIYGWLGWAPTYFVRELGWLIPQVGKLFGVILAVAGPVGALGGSWFADLWRRKGVATANLRIGVLSCAGMAIASTGMVFGGSPAVWVIFLALGGDLLLHAGRRRRDEPSGDRTRADARPGGGPLRRRAQHRRRRPRPGRGGPDHRLRAPRSLGDRHRYRRHLRYRERDRPPALPQRLCHLRRHRRRRGGLARPAHAGAPDPRSRQNPPSAAAH